MTTTQTIAKLQAQHDELVSLWKAGNECPALLAQARRIHELIAQLKQA